MWSHYASGHTGICLEFDVWMEDLCSAIKVKYRKKYPEFRIDNHNDISIFYIKSSDWIYEDEYRLIAEEEAEAFADATLKTRNGIYILPPRALRSVILGSAAPSSVAEQVYRLVGGASWDIIVRHAKCIPDRYALTIDPPI